MCRLNWISNKIPIPITNNKIIIKNTSFNEDVNTLVIELKQTDKTNVNIKNRLICYDIIDLGEQLQTIGMLVILDSIFNRISANRTKGKSTYIYKKINIWRISFLFYEKKCNLLPIRLHYISVRCLIKEFLN